MADSQHRSQRAQTTILVAATLTFASISCSFIALQVDPSPQPAVETAPPVAPNRSSPVPTEPRSHPVGKLLLVEGSSLLRLDVSCDRPLHSCMANPHYLTQQPALYAWPSWSPDGKTIVFASDLDASTSETLSLFTMSEDGTHLKSVVTAGHFPSWSPSGQAIAYGTWHDGGQIAAISPDGKQEVLALQPFATQPAWSPDGDLIAFIAGGPIPTASTLMLLDLQDGSVRGLAKHAAGAIAWSPDSKTIAFTLANNGKPDLYAIDVPSPGGRPALPSRLTSLGGVSSVSWSPDGRYILFTASSGTSLDVYLLKAQCIASPDTCQDSLRTIAQSPDSDRDPVWFPDAQHVVYATGRGSSWSIVLTSIEAPTPPINLVELTSAAEIDGFSYPE